MSRLPRMASRRYNFHRPTARRHSSSIRARRSESRRPCPRMRRSRSRRPPEGPRCPSPPRHRRSLPQRSSRPRFQRDIRCWSTAQRPSQRRHPRMPPAGGKEARVRSVVDRRVGSTWGSTSAVVGRVYVSCARGVYRRRNTSLVTKGRRPSHNSSKGRIGASPFAMRARQRGWARTLTCRPYVLLVTAVRKRWPCGMPGAGRVHICLGFVRGIV